MLIFNDLFGRRKSDYIAINQKPVKTPWGGGNQFIQLLERYLKKEGFKVTYKLRRNVRSVLLVAPKPFQNVTFDVEDIVNYKKENPYVKCVHRINQSNKGRNSNTVDRILAKANCAADHTVFISHWIKKYMTELWFDDKRPHKIIHNAADDDIFFPDKEKHTGPVKQSIQIVTHHWSDNWNKGFKIYQEVDRLIAAGELTGFNLNIVGRWPDNLRWRSAKVLPPLTGKKLAEFLRGMDIYLTGAIWEAGGMHHIEGAQCGLPVVYHQDGGGINELCCRYGVEYSENVRGALLEAKENLSSLTEKVYQLAPSGETMCKEYMEALLG